METAVQEQGLDEAFERIEGTILPTVSMMLDTLLEASALARPGTDSAHYAAELSTLAGHLEILTRQMASISPTVPADYRAASAA